MAPTQLCTLVFLLTALKFGAPQSSCRGRCGAEYYRGYMCQCDYSCLGYEECCKDYESQCTTKNSCKGRCGESFRRGRVCSCDSDCLKYKQCCPDYEMHCDAEDPTLTTADLEPFTVSEGNIQDDLKALDPSTSQDGMEDPEGSLIPESSTGAEPPTVASTQPTQSPQTGESTTETVMVSSEAEMSSSDGASRSTLQSAMDDALIQTTDASTPVAEETVTNSTQSSSEVQTGPTTPTSLPELETVGQVETQSEETSSPSAVPEITSPSIPTLSSITESTHISSVPASISPYSTAIAMETTPSRTQDVTTASPTLPTTSGAPFGAVSSSDPDVESGSTSSSSAAPRDGTTESSTAEASTASLFTPSLAPTSIQPTKATSAPLDKETDKPQSSKPESKPQDSQNHDNQQGYQADDSNDTNLCSGRPVGGVATLRNGTIVVFRGHYFWFLDRNRVPGPAQSITRVWGVPSPIDTVFTRCNCQGKTYIFKGGRYWRFENDALDPGYPRAVHTGFDGLQGHITAALSVPQYNQRRESVYFFKRGGFVQKYSYQSGTSPSCGRKTQYIVYKANRRATRQAVSVLERAINIRTSWKGFPTTVTAAVSIPSQAEPDGYKYYVFSRSNSYSVRMNGERPAVAASRPQALPQNDFFKCPRKV